MKGTKYIVGFLAVLVTLSAVYMTMDNVRMRIDSDKSTFYVPHEDYYWIWTVAGREQNKLMDGTSLMYRDLSSINVTTQIDGNLTVITRETKYIRGPVIIDTYVFNGSLREPEMFPIEHKVNILNGSGKFYRYEVRDLIYNGETYKFNGETSAQFERNMKVEIQEGYRWAWVYKSGILKAQYDINSDNETFYVRLFDPLISYEKEDIFEKLIKSEADLTRGYAEWVTYFPDSEVDSKLSVKKDFVNPFTVRFIPGKNPHNITSYKFYVKETKSKEEPVYERVWVEKTCERDLYYNDTKTGEEIYNTTVKYNCSEFITKETGTKTVYYDELIPIKDYEFRPLTKYRIVLKANWEAGLGPHSTDWVPEITLDKETTGLKEDIKLTREEWAWWNSSFGNCRNITIPNNADLEDIPLLLKLNSSRIDYSNTQDEGQDIRIIDNYCGNGGSIVPYEIEDWNESGDSFVWFKGNMTTTEDTIYSYYYYDEDAADEQNVSGVWDKDYVVVHHMNDDQDSTQYNLDISTISGASIDNNTEIGIGYDFDGNDYMRISHDSKLTMTGDFTLEAFTKWDTLDGSSWAQILGKNQDTGNDRYAMQFQTTSSYDHTLQADDSGGSTNLLASSERTYADTWYYLVGVRDSGTGYLYKNGSQDNTGSVESGTVGSSGAFAISTKGDSTGDYLDGIIDELRVSNVTRSADWVNQSYLSITDDLLSYGSEESATYVPEVYLIFPEDNYNLSSSSLDFQFNVTDGDDTTLNCSIYISDTLQAYNESTLNGTTTNITVSGLTEDYTTWNVSCNDSVSIDWSENRDINILIEYPQFSGNLTNTSEGGWTEHNLTITDNTDLANYTLEFCNGTYDSSTDTCVGFNKEKWANDTFEKCKNITIANSNGVISDYPAFVNVTFDSDMQTDFKDLRFYDTQCNNNGNELNYEIENYVASEYAEVWVRVPTLSNGDNVISVYYDNSSTIDDGQNITGTWDEHFTLVSHGEDGTTSTVPDSTNQQDGIKIAANEPIEIDGKVGKAQDFDGSNDRVDFGNSTTSILTSDVTIEAWFNKESNWNPSEGAYMAGFGKGNRYDLSYQIGFYERSASGDVRLETNVENGSGGCGDLFILSSTSFGVGSFAYYAGTFNDSEDSIISYVNGESDGTTACTYAPGDNGDNITAGDTDSGSVNEFDGIIDEFRISDIDRGQDYINMTYHNIDDYSNVISLGTEELIIPTTGNWNNESIVDISGTTFTMNETLYVNTTTDAVVAWRVYSWDSIGNLNLSDDYYYTVGVDTEAPQYVNSTAGQNTTTGGWTDLYLQWTDDSDLDDYIFSIKNGSSGGSATYGNYANETEAVEGTGDQDNYHYPAIAVNSTGSSHIAFGDFHTYKMRHCEGEFGSWSCEDAGDVENPFALYTDIDIDSNNNIYISFMNSSSDDLCMCNNTGGSWSCEVVQNIAGTTRRTRMAIDTSNNIFVGAFEVSAEPNPLTVCNNTDGSWGCEIADDTVSLNYWDMKADENDVIHICMGDSTLYYGNNSGGWTFSSAETGISDGEHCSLDIDSNGYPHISHRTWNGDNILRYSFLNSSGWHHYNLTDDTDTTTSTSMVLNNEDKAMIHVSQIFYDGGQPNGTYLFTNINGSWQNYSIDSDIGEYYSNDANTIANKKGRVSDSTTYLDNNKIVIVYPYNVGTTEHLKFAYWNISTTEGGDATYTNQSWTDFGATTSGWSNETFYITDTVDEEVCWQVYANDTSDNLNVSEEYCFTITSEAVTDRRLIMLW